MHVQQQQQQLDERTNHEVHKETLRLTRCVQDTALLLLLIFGVTAVATATTPTTTAAAATTRVRAIVAAVAEQAGFGITAWERIGTGVRNRASISVIVKASRRCDRGGEVGQWPAARRWRIRIGDIGQGRGRPCGNTAATGRAAGADRVGRHEVGEGELGVLKQRHQHAPLGLKGEKQASPTRNV